MKKLLFIIILLLVGCSNKIIYEQDMIIHDCFINDSDCFTQNAINSQTLAWCGHIQDGQEWDECHIKFAKALNVSICNKQIYSRNQTFLIINDSTNNIKTNFTIDWMKNCYIAFAIVYDNPDYCNYINDKSSCLKYFNLVNY